MHGVIAKWKVIIINACICLNESDGRQFRESKCYTIIHAHFRFCCHLSLLSYIHQKLPQPSTFTQSVLPFIHGRMNAKWKYIMGEGIKIAKALVKVWKRNVATEARMGGFFQISGQHK